MSFSVQRQPWGGYFEKANTPPPLTFWPRELGELSREDKYGWATPKSGCPFHISKTKKSFKVNLVSGRFCCFGCGVRGDLVDFIRKRDNCDFKTAAQRLGAWTDITWAGRAAIAQVWKEAEQRRVEAQVKAEFEKRSRLALRDELHAARALYDDLSTRLSELRRGAIPAYAGEEEHVWSLLPSALADVRLSDSMYCAVVGLEVG